MNKRAYEKASLKLDHTIHANIETLDIPFDENSFDYIVMGDVLEHLIDPQTILKKLYPLLKPGGCILIIVPNIRYWRVLLNLILKDEWEYKEWGILDYTHLRFFTKKSIVRLFKKTGLQYISANWVIGRKSKSSFLNKFTFSFFEGFLASHIMIKSKK